MCVTRETSQEQSDEEATGAARGKRVPAAKINNYDRDVFLFEKVRLSHCLLKGYPSKKETARICRTDARCFSSINDFCHEFLFILISSSNFRSSTRLLRGLHKILVRARSEEYCLCMPLRHV